MVARFAPAPLWTYPVVARLAPAPPWTYPVVARLAPAPPQTARYHVRAANSLDLLQTAELWLR